MLQVFLSRAVATESKQRHELLDVLPVALRAESRGIRTGRRWTSEPFEPKLTRPAFILVNGHLPYLLRLTALPTWHARHSDGFAHVAHIERQFNPGLGVGRDDLSPGLLVPTPKASAGPDSGAERILADRPGTKVLFISGYTEGVITQQSSLERGVDFLQKPFTPAQLAVKVREILDVDAKLERA